MFNLLFEFRNNDESLKAVDRQAVIPDSPVAAFNKGQIVFLQSKEEIGKVCVIQLLITICLISMNLPIDFNEFTY